MKRKIWIERIPGLFASLYEKASQMVQESYYARLAEVVVSRCPEGRILDLGTGPGRLPVEIARRSQGLRVDGLDLSPRLIRSAQTLAREAGVADRVQFQTAHAGKIPFADRSFDLVLSTGMLHMVKDPRQIFREAYRVLRPGGEAWFFDPARVSSAIDRKQWLRSLTFKERLAYRLFKLFSRINPGRAYTVPEVETLLQGIGFTPVRIDQEGKEIQLRLVKPVTSKSVLQEKDQR